MGMLDMRAMKVVMAQMEKIAESQKAMVEKQIDLLNELVKGDATIYLLLKALAKHAGMKESEMPKVYTDMGVESP